MSACIGMMNNKSIKSNQYNFDSQTNLDEQRKIFRQKRNNSQVFVPIVKKKDEFLISNSHDETNKNNSEEKIIDDKKIKQIQNIINKNFIINNKDKKAKLRGKSNALIKQKKLNNTDDNCDIIECDDNFECEQYITDSIKNVDLLSDKRANYLPQTNNIKNIKSYEQKHKNIKENENENKNNGILNDSFNNKDLNMELSISKNKIEINDIQRSTIFGNLINNEENGGKTLENENNKNKNEINKEINKEIKEKNKIEENKNTENKIEESKNIENKVEETKNYENKLKVIKDYYDRGNTNILENNNLLKITRPNNISFSEKNERMNKISENNNNTKVNKKSFLDNIIKASSIKKSNRSIRKNLDFNDCKIDNNINFNIDNSNVNKINNNNNLNNNIMSNFNNISSINSDGNNNNFVDISSNMTYFLSLEKSQRKPTTSRFDVKVLSLHKTKRLNSNGSDSSKISSNNYRNSVRVNKYKWKLLPKHKYKTQIYKSLIKIPLSHESQSLLMNEDDQKNLNLTLKYNTNENNAVITEIKKQKEQQDKIIKNLENKIKNLEKKINEEQTKEEENNQKISKLEEYMDKNKNNKNNEKKIKKNNSIKNDNVNKFKKINSIQDSQKDFRIKKLEEQLNMVTKNNKLNKSLLKQKDKQIQNLLHSKTKQDEIIKKYEHLKSINSKNNSNNNNNNYSYNYFHNNTMKGIKKINYLEDNSNAIGINSNIINTNNTNNNLTESKISITDLKNNKNLNSTTNLKINQKDIKTEREKMNKGYKKENSLTIQKHVLKNYATNFSDSLHLDQDNQENINRRGSMKDINKLKLNKNSNVKNNSKYNISNKSTSNISYYNYCNDLYNKAKNNYNLKIAFNKMKISKINKSLNLTINSDTKINKYFKRVKNLKQNMKEELNIDLNNTTKSCRKKFSFNKSKKLLTKNSEKSFRDMYLQAGTVQNEQNNSNCNINSEINYNYIKTFNYNDILILNNKNSFSNSNNNTTITNKINNDHNLSLSPMLFPSNYPNKNSSMNNISLEEKFNLSQSINNIQISNPNLKTNLNDDTDDINKIYQNLWNEGYLRYKQLTENVQNEKNNINDKSLKLKFCMANEIYEILVDKEELMEDVKNKFFELFFEKKNYGENEKKYINDNIIFLQKKGLIEFDKTVKNNNLENNEVIIPVLKDVTT